MFIAYKLELKTPKTVDETIYENSLDDLLDDLPTDKKIVKLINDGKLYKDEYSKNIEQQIDHYVTKDGSINASKLEDDWFPQLEGKQVFLSHSHKDENLAKGIASMLKEKGITVFIDSLVWNYCDKLLWNIDFNYCKRKSSNSFSYKLRNYSTSHVHNMLGVALMKMMDQCECVIFLNTENSIANNPLCNSKDNPRNIANYTHSPWIYHELQMMKYLRINLPSCLDYLTESAQPVTESASYGLPLFHYSVDLKDMPSLTLDQLIQLPDSSNGYPLLELYKSEASKVSDGTLWEVRTAL